MSQDLTLVILLQTGELSSISEPNFMLFALALQTICILVTLYGIEIILHFSSLCNTYWIEFD